MPHEPTLLDEDLLLSLQELAEACHLPAEHIMAMVEEGILEPLGEEPQQWRFTALMVTRIHIIQRLQRDLDINLPGAALAVELLEEMRRLRERVNSLEKILFKD